MAISSSTRKAGPYLGNDVTTVFPFAFKVFTMADLRVVNTSSLGVESDLTIDVDYTVSLNANQDLDPGGSITRAAALPTGERLTITSAVDALQPLVLTNNGGFYPGVINDAFDKITIIAQQLLEQVTRSLKLPISSSASATLPDPVANSLIAWSSDALGFVNVAPTDLATVSGYADARIELFTGTGSQTDFTIAFNPGVLANLDISLSGVTQVAGVDFTWLGTTITFAVAPPSGVVIQVRYARPLAPLPNFDSILTSVGDAEAAADAAAASAAEAADKVPYTALAASTGAALVGSLLKADIATVAIAGTVKTIRTQGYTTAGVGAASYVRTSYADIMSGGYPTSAYERSVDRLMPDGITTDAVNGGYWLLRPDGRLNVRQVGVLGDGTTSDAANWAGAAALAKAFGVPLWHPAGRYILPVTATVDISGIPSIDGDNAVLDFSGMTAPRAMTALGTPVLVASAIAITAGVGITATVAASDLKIGDTLLVVSNEQTAAATADASNYKGQRVTVTTNDGAGTITVTPPLLDDYTAAYLYRSDENKLRVGKGISVIGDPTVAGRAGLFLNFCDAVVEGNFSGFSGAACAFTNSKGLFIGTVAGLSNISGLGYGVASDDLSEVTVLATITGCRHCVKGGGGAYWTAAMVGGVGTDARIFPSRISVPGGQYFSHILHAIDSHASVESLNVGSGVQCGPIVSTARFTSIGAVTMYVGGDLDGAGQGLIVGASSPYWCDYRIDGLMIEFRGVMKGNTPVIYGHSGGRHLSIRNVKINGARMFTTGGLRSPVYITGAWKSVEIDGLRIRQHPDTVNGVAFELHCYSGCQYSLSRVDTDAKRATIVAEENGAVIEVHEPISTGSASSCVGFTHGAGATNGWQEIRVLNPRVSGSAGPGISVTKAEKVLIDGGYSRGNGGGGISALLTKTLTIRDADLTGNTGAAITQTDYGTGSTYSGAGNDERGSAANSFGAGVTQVPLSGSFVKPSSAYTVTNGTTDRAYDADTALVTETNDVLATLIADLKAAGVLT